MSIPRIGPRALDLGRGDRGPEHGRQAESELLRRPGRDQSNRRVRFPPAGSRGFDFFRTRVRKDGDRHECEQVAAERERGRQRPGVGGRNNRTQDVGPGRKRAGRDEQRHREREGPAGHPHEKARQHAARRRSRPEQHSAEARKELRHGDEGHEAQIGEPKAAWEQEVHQVPGGHDHRDQRPTHPAQATIEVAPQWSGERQHEVREAHARQRDGCHEDHRRGCRETAEEDERRQGRRLAGPGQREHVEVGIPGGIDSLSAPEHEWHGDRQQQEIERQCPADRAERPRAAAFREGEMPLPRQEERRRERQQEQRDPGAVGRRGRERRLGVRRDERRDRAVVVEHAEQRVGADGQERRQLDERLDRDGQDQSVVALARREVARAIERPEQHEARTRQHAHQFGGLRAAEYSTNLTSARSWSAW